MTKTEELRARCTPAERKALQAIAEEERLPTPEALRWIVRREAAKRNLWPPADRDGGQQAQA